MDRLGPAQVIAYARRFGLEAPIPPYLSVALGAAEATLLEMTSAYSVFPNRGVRMRPYEILKVSDRDGNLLEENRPEAHDAIRADTAYVMTNLLRGVIQHGTGAQAAALKWPLGGKTGTTNDYTDAWFIGFDPTITVGVWVGYDERKVLGNSETGAVAALPIWIDFMRGYIESRDPGAARSSRPPATSCSWPSTGSPGIPPPGTSPIRSTKPSSRAPSRNRRSPTPDADHSSSGADCPSVPLAFCIRYVLMNPSRSPSSTRATSPTSTFVR
jgi:penicillin-binding protein 1A